MYSWALLPTIIKKILINKDSKLLTLWSESLIYREIIDVDFWKFSFLCNDK